MTRFGDNPVTSTVSIPPRRQPGRDTSTRNRRDLLIPIKQTVVTKRHSDLREPQPSSSDSQPASSQPVSETTTSESSVSLPSSPSGSSCTESTSTSGTDSNSSSETSSEAAHSHLRMLRAQRQAVQPVHRRLHHPNCLRWSALSTACLRAQEIVKAIQWREAKWTTWETNSSVLPYWSKLPVSRRTNHGPSQCLQLQICHFPRIPEDVQVTRGLRTRCRQRMPTLLVRAVTQRQTDYRTFKKSLVDALDHPCQGIGQILHAYIRWRGEQPCQQQDETQEALWAEEGGGEWKINIVIWL